VPPLEAWEKVYIDDEEFLTSTHNKMGCVVCHGGDRTTDDMETAHISLVSDPSEGNCDTCHRDTAAMNESSLHTTLNGFKTALEARGADFEQHPELYNCLENHCQPCHTSCGQCHVSRPDEAGGGFISGHEFKQTPNMKNNCVACHGSRVGDEFQGGHGQELHGSGELAENRYHTVTSARCEDCHCEVGTSTDDNEQHEQHIRDLPCQVCHSVEYKNCYGCHVSIDDDGVPCRASEPSVMDFEIGLNPIQSAERPYEYAVLRHVPTCAGGFDFYGESLLPDFDSVPTWKYATPHNIQLNTPQNESCNSCHGNAEIFLTEDDIRPEELEANRGVIVTEIPDTVNP